MSLKCIIYAVCEPLSLGLYCNFFIAIRVVIVWYRKLHEGWMMAIVKWSLTMETVVPWIILSHLWFGLMLFIDCLLIMFLCFKLCMTPSWLIRLSQILIIFNSDNIKSLWRLQIKIYFGKWLIKVSSCQSKLSYRR